MDNFSNRMGLAPMTPIQKDSINEALINGAWTIVYNLLSFYIEYSLTGYDQEKWGNRQFLLEKKFYAFKWNEFYDFIEFFCQLIDDYNRPSVIKDFNRIFERENSAYIFVNQKIIEKISENEIAANELLAKLHK